MKLLCDVCESVVASVICCADEAALCASCDARVHAANKLASKHQRVPLLPDDDLNQAQPAVCDICQERQPFFFCVEDRALLCRECDEPIHSANPLTAKHKRYLLTGVRVDNSNAPMPPELAEPANSTAAPAATANSNKKAKLKVHQKPHNIPNDAGSNFLAELLQSNSNPLSDQDYIAKQLNDAEPQLLESSPMLKTLPRLSIQRMLSSGRVPFIAPVLSLLAADHHSHGPAAAKTDQFNILQSSTTDVSNVDKPEAENIQISNNMLDYSKSMNHQNHYLAHSLSPADNNYNQFNDSSSNITSSDWRIEELLSDFAESNASPAQHDQNHNCKEEKLQYSNADVDAAGVVVVGTLLQQRQPITETAAVDDISMPQKLLPAEDDVDSLTEAVVPEMVTNNRCPDVVRTGVKRHAATWPSLVDSLWELGDLFSTDDDDVNVADGDVCVVPDVYGSGINGDNDGENVSWLNIAKPGGKKRNQLLW